MKASTTLVFTALFALVGIVYFYVNPGIIPESPVKPIPIAADRSLLKLSSGDSVNWIQIQDLAKKTSVTLARQDGKWMIKYPITYPANEWILQRMAQTLETGTRARPFLPEKNWNIYGLLDPSLKIGIQTEKGSARHYLSVGTLAPLGNYVYARMDKEKEFFLLEGDILGVFGQSVYQLREKRVFRISRNAVTKFEMQISDESFEVLFEKGVWKWTKPESVKGMTVDAVTIDGLLNVIGDIYIKDFLDKDKSDNPEFGLQQAANKVRIWGSGEKPETLIVGRETAVRHSYYALLEGEAVPMLIDTGKIQALYATVKNMTESRVQVAANAVS